MSSMSRRVSVCVCSVFAITFTLQNMQHTDWVECIIVRTTENTIADYAAKCAAQRVICCKHITYNISGSWRAAYVGFSLSFECASGFGTARQRAVVVLMLTRCTMQRTRAVCASGAISILVWIRSPLSAPKDLFEKWCTHQLR